MFNQLSRVSETILVVSLLEDQRNTVMFSNNDAKRKEENKLRKPQQVSSQNITRDERKGIVTIGIDTIWWDLSTDWYSMIYINPINTGDDVRNAEHYRLISEIALKVSSWIQLIQLNIRLLFQYTLSYFDTDFFFLKG